jgi:hypothetical protein
MPENRIRDDGDLRKWRTEIPNIIDDWGLDVYSFRLYVHLKRVAGDNGDCFQSTDSLAAACCMSAGAVSNAKQALKEAGLIEIELSENDHGGRKYHNITIKNIWPENFKKFLSSSRELASSPHEGSSSPHELASSPGELKKEPIKKEPIKKMVEYESEPDEIFSRMQHTCEQLIGRLCTPGDLPTIEAFIREGVLEEDIRSALAWRVEQKIRPVANIRQLEAGVLRSKAARTQAANAAAAPVSQNGNFIPGGLSQKGKMTEEAREASWRRTMAELEQRYQERDALAEEEEA